ncbi:hypothetical protein SLEP1_g3711 [Rubroshorea leprosula]|uniref:Uncharacterized protein n=1 Tax=Rubroshorea leprosula TaxID=152421 RepID=A0AAV5HLA7_9ROSI|nr:hypothetical protein SLEP1_g3711 [Rubroshorea leprosula]
MVDRGGRAKLKSVPMASRLLANSTWKDFHILLLQYMKFHTWSNDSSNYGNVTWVVSFDLQQLFPIFPSETYVESLKLDVVHGSTLNCFHMCQGFLWWLEGRPFCTVILVLLLDNGSLMLDVETLRIASRNSKILQMRLYFGRVTEEVYKLVLLYLLLLAFQLNIRLSFHAPLYLVAPIGLAFTCLLELTIILHRKMVDRGKGLIQ